jgi:O-antigen/teichoic acid export membrane protein
MPRVVPASYGQVAYAQAAREHGRTPVRGYLVRAWTWMIAAVVVACVAGVWFVHRLDPVYLEAIAPLILLSVAEILLVPFGVVLRMILGGGRVGSTAVVGVVAAVLSAGAYWFAISAWGMLGAAGASILVYGGVSLACVVIYRSTRRQFDDDVRSGDQSPDRVVETGGTRGVA